jgi:hypothetical protein
LPPRAPAVKQLERSPGPEPVTRDPAALAAKILHDAQIDPGDLRLPAGPADPGTEAELAKEDLAKEDLAKEDLAGPDDGITLQELFGNRRETAS